MSIFEPKDVDPKYDPDKAFLYAAAVDLDSRYDAKKLGAFIILNHRGKQMKLRSGKMVWKTKGAATLALNNHLIGHKTPFEYALEQTNLTSEEYTKMLKKKFPTTKDYRLWLQEKGLVTIKEMI